MSLQADLVLLLLGPLESLNWVNRQLSNSLKFNRLPSKRRQRQKCRFKLTVKTFKVFHISMTSRLQLIFTEFWLLNLNWQNQFSCSRITRPYNLPISKTICKFYKWKAKTISKPQQLITISTEVTVEPPLTVTSPQRQRPLKLVPNCRNNLPTTATVFSDWRNGHETSTINRDKSFNSFKMKKQYFFVRTLYTQNTYLTLRASVILYHYLPISGTSAQRPLSSVHKQGGRYGEVRFNCLD